MYGVEEEIDVEELQRHANHLPHDLINVSGLFQCVQTIVREVMDMKRKFYVMEENFKETREAFSHFGKVNKIKTVTHASKAIAAMKELEAISSVSVKPKTPPSPDPAGDAGQASAEESKPELKKRMSRKDRKNSSRMSLDSTQSFTGLASAVTRPITPEAPSKSLNSVALFVDQVADMQQKLINHQKAIEIVVASNSVTRRAVEAAMQNTGESDPDNEPLPQAPSSASSEPAPPEAKSDDGWEHIEPPSDEEAAKGGKWEKGDKTRLDRLEDMSNDTNILLGRLRSELAKQEQRIQANEELINESKEAFEQLSTSMGDRQVIPTMMMPAVSSPAEDVSSVMSVQADLMASQMKELQQLSAKMSILESLAGYRNENDAKLQNLLRRVESVEQDVLAVVKEREDSSKTNELEQAADLIARVETMQRKEEDRKAALSDQDRKIVELEVEIRNLRGEISKSEKSIDHMNMLVSTLNRKIEELSSTTRVSAEQLAAERERSSKLEASTNKLQKDFKNTIAELNEKTDGIAKIANAAHTYVHLSPGQIEAIVSVVDRHSEELASLFQSKADVNAVQSALDGKLDSSSMDTKADVAYVEHLLESMAKAVDSQLKHVATNESTAAVNTALDELRGLIKSKADKREIDKLRSKLINDTFKDKTGDRRAPTPSESAAALSGKCLSCLGMSPREAAATQYIRPTSLPQSSERKAAYVIARERQAARNYQPPDATNVDEVPNSGGPSRPTSRLDQSLSREKKESGNKKFYQALKEKQEEDNIAVDICGMDGQLYRGTLAANDLEPVGFSQLRPASVSEMAPVEPSHSLEFPSRPQSTMSNISVQGWEGAPSLPASIGPTRPVSVSGPGRPKSRVSTEMPDFSVTSSKVLPFKMRKAEVHGAYDLPRLSGK